MLDGLSKKIHLGKNFIKFYEFRGVKFEPIPVMLESRFYADVSHCHFLGISELWGSYVFFVKLLLLLLLLTLILLLFVVIIIYT